MGRSVDPAAEEVLDSQSFPAIPTMSYMTGGGGRHGGVGGQSSSELSSPNETCYSFVRRAIQVYGIKPRNIIKSDEEYFMK